MSWRTLVVDDEPGYCELLKRVAEKAGFEVTATTCSDKAVSLLHSGKVDLLITDLDMPKWNGFDLVEMAAGLPRPPRVLVITAQKGMLAQDPRRMRSHHCLLKPFELSDLRAKLALLTGRWQQQGQHEGLSARAAARV